MPNPTISTRYAGEVYEKILAKAATGNELFERGLIHVETGVQDKLAIPRLQLSKILQKRKEMPTSEDAKGDINIDERVLEPHDAMVYIEFNPRLFEHIWRKWQPTGNLVFEELPANIQAQLLEAIVSQLGEELGVEFIQGEYGENEGQYFDGILTRISKAAKEGKAVTAVCSDSSQIKRLRAVWKATKANIRDKADFVFLMSKADWDAYDDELADLHHKGADPTEQNVKRFKGHRVEPLEGMPDDVIIGTLASLDANKTNLFAAVNLVNDFNAILIDKVTNAGEKYFCKMLLKADTQIAWDELCTILDNRDASGDDSDSGSSTPTISGDTALSVDATAKSNVRTYATSNGAAVTAEVITEGADWLTVSVSGNKVTFTRTAYAANAEGSDPRVAKVKIGIAGTDADLEVTVSQAKATE